MKVVAEQFGLLRGIVLSTPTSPLLSRKRVYSENIHEKIQFESWYLR